MRDNGSGVSTSEAEEIPNSVFSTPLSKDFFEREPKSHERCQPVEVELLTVEVNVDTCSVALINLGPVVG
jgi:hypothetical protein